MAQSPHGRRHAHGQYHEHEGAALWQSVLPEYCPAVPAAPDYAQIKVLVLVAGMGLGADPDEGTSLYVLAATDMSLFARCRLPIELPSGFHGEWIPS